MDEGFAHPCDVGGKPVLVEHRLGLLVVPARWVGLLGLLPLAFGLWKLVGGMRKAPDADMPSSVAAGLTGVGSVAILNGAC